MRERDRLPETGGQPIGTPVEPRYKELLALVGTPAVVVAVLVVIGVLAVAAGTGLDALLNYMSGPCFATAITATTYGMFAGYLSSFGMIVSGVGMGTSLLALSVAAMNENMHHMVMHILYASIIGLLVSAAIVPLTAVIGCAAS